MSIRISKIHFEIGAVEYFMSCEDPGIGELTYGYINPVNGKTVIRQHFSPADYCDARIAVMANIIAVEVHGPGYDTYEVIAIQQLMTMVTKEL